MRYVVFRCSSNYGPSEKYPDICENFKYDPIGVSKIVWHSQKESTSHIEIELPSEVATFIVLKQLLGEF
jgi:hypothetical protein